MIDSNLAVKTWLSSSQAITGLVGDRIYCGMLPEGYDPEVDGDAITFFTRTGTAHPELPLISPSVQIECWSQVHGQQRARAVYRAVFDLCHQKNHIDLGEAGYILSSTEEVQGQDLIDPDTKWAEVLTYYRLTMRA
jgi:hypothetical protein